MGNFNENFTLSYAGHFESDGAAHNITIPFEPDAIFLYNYTKYGTAAENVESIWFKDFPAGDALVKQVIADNGATANTNCNLETTNGVTTNNTAAAVADSHATITGATAANPVVVTATAHGFGAAAAVVRVRISKVAGMVELNEVNRNPYQATIIDANSFSLQDLDGNNIDGSAFTAYSSGGQANLLTHVASPIEYADDVWGLTLGSVPMANDGDEIYFIAWKFGEYVDLGDVA